MDGTMSFRPSSCCFINSSCFFFLKYHYNNNPWSSIHVDPFHCNNGSVKVPFLSPSNMQMRWLKAEGNFGRTLSQPNKF
jgi:hypothetical protein